ncbi:hypothetical protein Tco_0590593, partial [Tanacetum coccineum]
ECIIPNIANSTTEAECVAAANCYGQVGDKVVHKELDDRMKRATTTASRCQDTILGGAEAQTRFEAASK